MCDIKIDFVFWLYSRSADSQWLLTIAFIPKLFACLANTKHTRLLWLNIARFWSLE